MRYIIGNIAKAEFSLVIFVLRICEYMAVYAIAQRRANGARRLNTQQVGGGHEYVIWSVSRCIIRHGTE